VGGRFRLLVLRKAALAGFLELEGHPEDTRQTTGRHHYSNRLVRSPQISSGCQEFRLEEGQRVWNEADSQL
jgi:hypothetical protein